MSAADRPSTTSCTPRSAASASDTASMTEQVFDATPTVFIFGSRLASNMTVTGRPPTVGINHLPHCVVPYRSDRETAAK